MEKIIIFTDGSSRGNPGPGGWGAIVAWGLEPKATEENKVIELGGREEMTTNNRMEMMAVIEALSFIDLKLKTENLKIVIYCDSSYVINGATLWAKGWEANEWKTKANQDVLNKDLWEEILSLTEKFGSKFHLEWKQIEGHAGIVGNERCDVIATSFAGNDKINLYNGEFSSYGLNIFSLDKNIIEKTKN